MYRLLGTAGCHLCEQAAQLLTEVSKTIPIEVIATDIAEETDWQEAYAIRIPVLYHIATQRELSWPFTQEQLLFFIRELNHDH